MCFPPPHRWVVEENDHTWYDMGGPTFWSQQKRVCREFHNWADQWDFQLQKNKHFYNVRPPSDVSWLTKAPVTSSL